MKWTTVSKSLDIEAVRQAAEALDVNERDERGRTPLMLLITNRMPVEAVMILLERGAELEAEDRLGETALIKAVKFQQPEAVRALLKAGARLDSPRGILYTAWHAARSRSLELTDLLLATPGAVRLNLSKQEQQAVDAIVYEPSEEERCRLVAALESEVLLHAVVQQYNWDDGPETMIAILDNAASKLITLLDMDDLLDSGYWLSQEAQGAIRNAEDMRWRELAVRLHERLSSDLHA